MSNCHDESIILKLITIIIIPEIKVQQIFLFHCFQCFCVAVFLHLLYGKTV